MKKWNIIAVIIFAVLVVLGVEYYLQIGRRSRGIPFIRRDAIFSLGLYHGDAYDGSPLSPKEITHILSASDITDRKAKFLADPFMVQEDGVWYLFFEVLNQNSLQGDIGVATSNDLSHWTYQQIVLDEPFHLSYPQVFKWNGDYYMIPESTEDQEVRLYKATDFPYLWEYQTALLKGKYVDSSIVYYQNRWWLFASPDEWMAGKLDLYYADQLEGPWQKHPMSPIVQGDERISRSGGRIVSIDGHLLRFSQDDYPYYGHQIRAIEIEEMTPTTYRETEYSPDPVVTGSGSGWNAGGMHQVDFHDLGADGWIASVDGFYWKYVFDLTY